VANLSGFGGNKKKLQPRNRLGKKVDKQALAIKQVEDANFRKVARKMLSNPKYLKTVQERLNDCTLHPSVHVALLYYAYDKPTEHIEKTEVTPVRIEHRFTRPIDDKPEPAE
jgi:hypothetical protein